MHIVDYFAISFLIFCMLLAATRVLGLGKSLGLIVIVVAAAQVVALGATHSPRRPIPSPILQQQNQADRGLDRSQDGADDEQDLLSLLD